MENLASDVHWTLLPHILCDGCKLPMEEKKELKCSACQSAFYCSKECQKIYWKSEHKEMCSILMSVIAGYDKKRADRAIVVPARRVKQTEAKGEECGICFDKMDAPLILACNHVYCVKCLFEHTSNRRRDCPTCRQDMLGGPERPALHHYIYASAADFLRQANALEKGSAERTKLCEMAKSQLTYLPKVRQHFMDLFQSFRHSEDVDEADIDEMVSSFQEQYETTDVVSQMTLGEVYMCEGDPVRAAEMFESLLGSNQRSLDAVFQNSKGSLHLLLAEALYEIGDYAKARQYAARGGEVEGSGYDAKGQPIHESAVTQRKIYNMLGNCDYHLGEYKRAVKVLELSLEANRFYDDVYQDLARCYEALGETENAKRVIEKAVVYQLPWQKEIKERNRMLLAKYL